MNEQEKTNFINTILGVLESLNPRSQDVVIRRFGLKNGRPETLESIGKKYKITRERVRQIEEAALRELRKNFDNFKLDEETAKIKAILQKYGNVIREDLLFQEFSGSSEYDKTNAALVCLMTISSGFERYPENEKFWPLWTLKDPVYIETTKGLVEKAIQIFKKHKKVVPEAELTSFLAELLPPNSDPKVFLSYLSISKLISKNIFDQWGLIDWSEIRPKGIREKAYLVLKINKKPFHFKEIAQLINNYKFDSKKANVQTVHNELIKDKRFVLVGRGLYALAEWGVEPGTVKDVLIRLLRKHGPMPKDEIIAKTAEVRFVKPNTIILNLQDKKYFQKDEKGFYKLVKEA